VVVLDSVITHTSAWFLDRDIHQLVYSHFSLYVFGYIITSNSDIHATKYIPTGLTSFFVDDKTNYVFCDDRYVAM